MYKVLITTLLYNVGLLRRRTNKSSLAFDTNVKHFEVFYDICFSCVMIAAST
jgi:hypothetical protein